MKKTINGFTIVELLIVIVVIAILAAISIVAYNGIQERARTTAHQALATQTERAIMVHALQSNGESIQLSGSLIGYREGVGDIKLLKPLTGTPDVTMYAVYTVTGTTSSYPSFALLTPTATGYQIFNLRAEASGSSQLGSRIDTQAQSNAVGSTSGTRVIGNTVIGWLQVSNNMTARAWGYNQAAGSAGTLSPSAGWVSGFDGASLTNNDGIGRAVMVFNAAHDQSTRQQVISWLAQKYGVSL